MRPRMEWTVVGRLPKKWGMKTNVGQSRKGARVLRDSLARRHQAGRGVSRLWVFDRQPALSLDEEPVVHGSGGEKLRVAKEGEL